VKNQKVPRKRQFRQFDVGLKSNAKSMRYMTLKCKRKNGISKKRATISDASAAGRLEKRTAIIRGFGKTF